MTQSYFTTSCNILLQSGLNELRDWTQHWLLLININKCKVMSVGRNVDKSYYYNIIDINNQSIALERSNQFKDLGVLVDEKLSFKDHIQDKINKAFSMLGIIKRNFKHLDMYSFILLYKSMVRSQLDYCSSVYGHLTKKVTLT